MQLKYLVNLDFVGIGNAAKAYGGRLDAWSFMDINPESWFSMFRQVILDNIGKKYVPVYRMADGEYRFLMGRKYNLYKKPLVKELIAVTAEKLYIKNPNNWKTSWGEKYSSQDFKYLRNKLITNIKEISENGYLACYINNNGLHAFTEYNNCIQPFFLKNGISFNSKNYVPFHFVCALLVNQGWEEFYYKRNILVISGTDEKSEAVIVENLEKLGVSNVEFIRVSRTSAMKDLVDLSNIKTTIDLCLVAAGIGSANILLQLKPLHTVVLDIGGYINCYIDKNLIQHGGVFRYPLF